MKLLFKQSAEKSLQELSDYLSEEIKMPETADKYIDKMKLFAESITKTPNAHSICKYPPWQKRQFFCTVFDKKWVFAFKIVKNNVVVFYVKPGKLLNY
jgi:hypothetical protein